MTAKHNGKSAPRIPSYRLHRASGQAVVTLSGKDFYLGRHGSPESRAEYDRRITEWIAAGRRLARPDGRGDLTVVKFLAAYWTHCGSSYSRDTLITTIKPSVVRLRRLYGHTRVADFDPIALKTIRQCMVNDGLSRSYINTRIRWIKTCFRWGVEEGLVPADVLHRLEAVGGLRRGRCDARETDPVRPAPDAAIEATLPHLPPVVADMVRVQRLTGMRPGEVCAMTPGEVDRSRADVWLYVPLRHKTAHHGHARIVPIGPKAQAILRAYVERGPDEPLFSPAESERRRYAELRTTRATPVTPSQREREAARAERADRQREPGSAYQVGSYRRAIGKACMRAGIEPWTPNQLRHTRATELRQQFGLDAASAVLGHRRLETTQVYAERDLGVAIAAALETG